MELFGFVIKRKDEVEDSTSIKSFVEPSNANDDGAIAVGAGGQYGFAVDIDVNAKTEADLVQKYRTMMQHPEVQIAVDDIVNEAINITDEKKVVECVTDDIEFSESIKKKIRDEFDYCLKLLDFSNQGYEIFTRWYVDGRLYYHVVIDEKNIKKGIQELRYIDPRKIRKIREYETPRDSTALTPFIRKVKAEYYIFNDRFMTGGTSSVSSQLQGLKIAKDSIVHCNSGVLNEKNTAILSHLHKAYKPLNQLRMMEDASVIYRITRAPERRVFYIDVGNLPKAKAEQYLRDMMVRHKNKLVYDANTGEIRDDRKFMTMTEDFWLPRREGGKGTEIQPLAGGQNLGEMEDILYFQKNLYKSLNVPTSRLEADNGFSLGRSSEITRDEVKFSKFVKRLRARFSNLFDQILEKQLILKGIISPDDWDQIKNKIRYDFMFDNHFEELKSGEILRERLNLLSEIDNYVGVYYSKEWVRKNILKLTEDEIDEIKKQIDREKIEEPEEPKEDGDGDGVPDLGQGGPEDQDTGPVPQQIKENKK